MPHSKSTEVNISSTVNRDNLRHFPGLKLVNPQL